MPEILIQLNYLKAIDAAYWLTDAYYVQDDTGTIPLPRRRIPINYNSFHFELLEGAKKKFEARVKKNEDRSRSLSGDLTLKSLSRQPEVKIDIISLNSLRHGMIHGHSGADYCWIVGTSKTWIPDNFRNLHYHKTVIRRLV